MLGKGEWAVRRERPNLFLPKISLQKKILQKYFKNIFLQKIYLKKIIAQKIHLQIFLLKKIFQKILLPNKFPKKGGGEAPLLLAGPRLIWSNSEISAKYMYSFIDLSIGSCNDKLL